MRIQLVMLGKTRRAELRALLDDYLGRVSRYAEVEVLELRDAAQLAKPSTAAARKLAAEPAARWVLLDAAGRQLTSAEFARWLAAERDRGARALVFLCGDAEGFPDALRRRAQVKLSLSTLTMPHELARVVLAEQLYRAFALLSGHPYPR